MNLIRPDVFLQFYYSITPKLVAVFPFYLINFNKMDRDN